MLRSKASIPRYTEVAQQKFSGSTYTPEELATFVADQMINVAELPKGGKIRVLDPAVGDGALLLALIRRIPHDLRKQLDIFGFDTDEEALRRAEENIGRHFPDLNTYFEKKDFLEYLSNVSITENESLFSQPSEPFHLVIANPPYVRTQILGARQTQLLARRFGLTGRVDLYYPFLLGISQVLAPGGVTGVITSNRFMTTKSGQGVRAALLSRFRILHVWDLGDTKLFDAAVLPSILLAQGVKKTTLAHTNGVTFTTIYETQSPGQSKTLSALEGVALKTDTVIEIPDGRRFQVRHGKLDNGGNSSGVWRIGTRTTDKWLSTVDAKTWNTFRRIGKIRVGVKSTADKVFIRDDWDTLSDGRPELLRTLITRQCARRFKAAVPQHTKEILYPHEMTATGRGPVDLKHFPKAENYLEKYRDILESRTYLIEAGRRWYELWVPQDPAAWDKPKLVFPDISERPIFWIDTNGGVVGGECYWLQCTDQKDEDLLWLALAIANSTFIEAFYDHRFNNKLYSGRRRFMTQYVEQFPLPDPNQEEAISIVETAKAIYAKLPSIEAQEMEANLDEQVWRVFGLHREKIDGERNLKFSIDLPTPELFEPSEELRAG